MRIALAQVSHPVSFEAGLGAVQQAIAAVARAGARLVCVPECCLKGMRGTGYPVEALTMQEHDLALGEVRAQAAAHRIAVVLPTERPYDGASQNGAYLVQADGVVQGYQTKNQVPLEEEPFFVPGDTRRLPWPAGRARITSGPRARTSRCRCRSARPVSCRPKGSAWPRARSTGKRWWWRTWIRRSRRASSRGGSRRSGTGTPDLISTLPTAH